MDSQKDLDLDPAYIEAKRMIDRADIADREGNYNLLDLLIEDLEHDAMGDASRSDPLDCELWVVRVKKWIQKIQNGDDDA